MSIFSRHFPLGLGTSRFPVVGPNDAKGLENSIKLACSALELGIDYIDVGHNYSAGMAPMILKEAFRQTTRPFSVTVKVQYGEDKTADDARKRVEMHLKAMGLNKAEYFTSWCIWSYSDFEKIMAKGGIYEGALKLKEEGIINHICCSLHAPPNDMIKILASGAFEGATISYSLLNAPLMQPVLDKALDQNIGIAVMNPLGGGLIAKNKDYFSFACNDREQGETIHAALRFVKAHPAVDIVLGGVNSKEELEDSINSFSNPDTEEPQKRISRVLEKVSSLSGFCTGCKYWIGCPKGSPTAAIMQAHNSLLFHPATSYNRNSPDELLYNLQIFRKLFIDEGWVPETFENPCVSCGRCEKKCTQKLNIIEAVADIYKRAKDVGYSKLSHCNRLKELLYNKGYRKVGLYPSGGFSKLVINLYKECFGEPNFEWFLFNSDPKTWEGLDGGLIVHSPSDIPKIKPDVILVSTYRFDQEIFDSLQIYKERYGIKVEKLHRKNEVPWVF